ncbi:hypothetical protein F5B21DRAFT_505376 [Xylaria acuta]|nr:hypothetical protein F5B21DRAFT_505376 [Xylaria acuta]
MSLLDINPEGHLDQEIEDVLEELDIMPHLSNTHNNTLKKSVEQAEHILDPDGEFKGKIGSNQQIRSQGWLVTERAEDYITELKKLRESAKKTDDDVGKGHPTHVIR